MGVVGSSKKSYHYSLTSIQLIAKVDNIVVFIRGSFPNDDKRRECKECDNNGQHCEDWQRRSGVSAPSVF